MGERMSDYKRLTERDEYGNADIIGLSTEKLFGELYFDEINLLTKALNKLAFLEDKIENKTLVEFNKPFYSNQLKAWCIYLREGDYIKTLCLTKEQAEEYQKKLQEKQK